MFDLDSISNDVVISPNTTKELFPFTFDIGSPSQFLEQKVKQRNMLANRLERLINEPTVGGHPFVRYLFSNVPEIDPEELITLSKALAKIAELVEPYRKIDAEVKGLNFVNENPNLIACAFGAFESPDSDFFIKLEDKK